MDERPIVVGVDPGFASIGLSRLALERALDGSVHAELLDVRVIETQPSGKKRAVYASDDNLRRVFEIYDLLLDYFVQGGQHPCVVAAEAMSFARNASASGKVCLTWGVLGALTHANHIPLVQTLPQEVKQQVAGKRTASKEEIQLALRALYPAALPPLMAKMPKGKHEHAADALAVAHGALTSPIVLAVVKTLR